MIGMASTRISVLRGTKVNADGDIVDDNESVAASGIPAGLSELALPFRDWFSAESTRDPRHVRRVVARMPNQKHLQDYYGVAVEETDRIKDEVTGLIYLVDRVVQQQGYSHTPDLRVVLKRSS